MKKIISLIFCIALLTLVLVSCGDEEHVHQYNRDEWKSDATNHWYAATCDCEDAEPQSVAKHFDTMNDGFCDICNYLMCSNTAHSEILKHNDNTHWYDPVCGHNGQDSHILPKDFSEHTYDAAGLCTECGYQCAKTEYKENWSTNENNHWHDPACGHTHLPVLDSAAHVDLDENEEGVAVGDGVCDICGYVMCSVPVKAADESDEDFQARLDAFYNADPSYDEFQHWYEPVCGHIGHDLKGLGIHKEEQEGADGFCDECYEEIPDYEQGE